MPANLIRLARTAVLSMGLAICALAHAATAFIDGEAVYVERMLPPPGAALIVTLQDASRVGAPAIEYASTSLRVTGGPPYAWRLAYDTTGPSDGSRFDPQRLTVRARITTPAGLWMTTDTMVLALGGPEPLRLRLVALGAQQQPTAPAPDTAVTQVAPGSAVSAASASAGAQACASAVTQVDLNRCAFEDFEASGSGYALRYKELSQSLPTAQRNRLRHMQSAWLKYRTDACRFESGTSAGGSAQQFINWRCAARMTRERTLELQALATCREGDISCSRGKP